MSNEKSIMDPASPVVFDITNTAPDTLEQLWNIWAALNGNNDGQRRIATIGLSWLDLLLRKNCDYGSAVWQPSLLAPDVSVDAKIRVRMSDKLERINNLLKQGAAQVKEETLDDCFTDLGAYCLLRLARPPVPAAEPVVAISK